MKHNINPQEIVKDFSTTSRQAQVIVDLIEGETSPDPYVEDHERSRRGFRHEAILAAINNLIEACGVESLFTNGDSWSSASAENKVVASYTNTGDTYSPVILYDHIKNHFTLTTVGDFVEYAEASAPEYGCKLVLTQTDVGIVRRTFEDDDGAEYIDFEVDYFAEQDKGNCDICGAEIEEGILCLDGGEEYCWDCVFIQQK
jgi:hypothetical protein